jgi:hypothetical protein
MRYGPSMPDENQLAAWILFAATNTKRVAGESPKDRLTRAARSRAAYKGHKRHHKDEPR